MKKTEFQKFAYSEISKVFSKLFAQGSVNKYTSEARWDRQKIKYDPEYQKSLAIYFFRNGTIKIYQNGSFGECRENPYYEWNDTSDYKDVVAALKKDITEFVKRLNSNKGRDDLPHSWGHDCFYEFAYETSKFKKQLSTE